MSARARLLVVDDEPDLRTLYELTLVREGYEVDSAGTVNEAWDLLQGNAYQAVITDLRLPDGTGLDLLLRIEGAARSERTVVITAYGSAENAVEVLKAGAFDYLTKPVDLRQFRAVVASAAGTVIESAAEGSESRTTAIPAKRERMPGSSGRAALQRMAGSSGAMVLVRELVERVATSMAPVLVRGESGTGKELVARAIHERSPRGGMPFVAVNCGAIPEALLEAEFFGYRKGAFTGASDDREGLFQAARGGTLFLDEIGDLPLSMQSKLLRAIQERAVRPLGATQETHTDVRLVSATHQDLVEAIASGRFRQDLYYRLNVIRIDVPPLRERLEDLPILCRALLERIARDAGVETVPVMTEAALRRLAHHSFPGNVRELENLLHRALAMSGADQIEEGSLAIEDAASGESLVGALEPAQAMDLGSSMGLGASALPGDLVAYLDAIERDVLERALRRHRYNRTAAGASLGLSLRQMRYRMARLGVGVGDTSEAG